MQGWTAQDYKLGYDEGNWLQIDAETAQGIAGVTVQVKLISLSLSTRGIIAYSYFSGGSSAEFLGYIFLREDFSQWKRLELG